MSGFQGMKGTETNSNKKGKHNHPGTQLVYGHQVGQPVTRRLRYVGGSEVSERDGCRARGRLTLWRGGRRFEGKAGMQVLRRNLQKISSIRSQLLTAAFRGNRRGREDHATARCGNDLFPTRALRIIAVLVY